MRWTPLFALFLAAHICSAVATAAPTHAYVDIPCCELMGSMLWFITVKDGFMECEESECMNRGLIWLFLSESGSLGHVAANGTALRMHMRSDETQVYADMLAWSFIGRCFTGGREDDKAHYNFDTISQTMTARRPWCEFQRSMYVVMLLVIITVLVFSMGLSVLESQERQTVAPTPRPRAGRVRHALQARARLARPPGSTLRALTRPPRGPGTRGAASAACCARARGASG